MAVFLSSANSPALTENSTGSAPVDDLPAFATLTTDEDREKKAERSNPGTYNVVVNQDSFQHLPEYNDDADVKRELLSPLRRGSIATSRASSGGRESAVDGIAIPGDPNVVVLPRFEDVTRRGTFSSKEPRSPISPIARPSIIKKEDQEEAIMTEEPTTMTDAIDTDQDARYLRQFRQVVWRQLVPAEPDQRDGMARSSVNLLELAAKAFAPVCDPDRNNGVCSANWFSQLHHAMVAVAALSLAVQDGKERLDALQHYQQALPALQFSLRSPQDLSSDGAFLTHFVLLVYEVRWNPRNTKIALIRE